MATETGGFVNCMESLLDNSIIKIPFTFAYVTIFFVCLTGNLFTIIVICAHRSMRTATNFFLANLALADLLVAIFCILQNMFHLIHLDASWPLGEKLCKMYGFILHLAPCTSIGILVCVSVEKYIAVLHPLLALKLLTPRFRSLMMAAIWICSVLASFPYYTTSRYHVWPEGNYYACGREHDKNRLVSTRNMVNLQPLQMLGMVKRMKEGKIKKKKKKMKKKKRKEEVKEERRRRRRKEEDVESNGSHLEEDLDDEEEEEEEDDDVENDNRTKCHLALGNGSVTHLGKRNSAPSSSTVVVGTVESRKRIIRLLIAIVCSFAVLTLPHHVRLIYSAVIKEDKICLGGFETLTQPLTYLLLFLSSSCNPFLYAFMSQRFRSAIRDIFKCRRGHIRRKSTKTRTQNSDVLCAVNSGDGIALSACSSLNKLNNFNTLEEKEKLNEDINSIQGRKNNNNWANKKLEEINWLKVKKTKNNEHSNPSGCSVVLQLLQFYIQHNILMEVYNWLLFIENVPAK
ncbi:G_PROTEIN_RECEP_F1_2 domain-containing protein [Meloidogyne graminicola]|uniref:G_PROTEIN_RECEP_F1_2 domain-containing protein n=1 Tax=Meloidogyne graminicola TaxID=189291 RepID=A0A8S9ZR09_9BILA|nr:G_PROTEIN_RECEP_F1_2 domain-containing protein [Meloidogyne graminicola]